MFMGSMVRLNQSLDNFADLLDQSTVYAVTLRKMIIKCTSLLLAHPMRSGTFVTYCSNIGFFSHLIIALLMDFKADLYMYQLHV